MIHQLYTKEKEILFYYLICFLICQGKSNLHFLTVHSLHISRTPTFYSRKLHILFNALWSAKAFLHSVDIKDFHSFCPLKQIIGYWCQFIPQMIPANQFKMQIYSFLVQKCYCEYTCLALNFKFESALATERLVSFEKTFQNTHNCDKFK